MHDPVCANWAIQAASDTISDVERQFTDREYQSLKQEIDRIANVTQLQRHSRF